MVGAHVLTNPFVRVFGTVGAREARVAHARLLGGIAHAVVGTPVGADLNLAGLAAVRGWAVAPALEAHPHTATTFGTLSHLTLWARVSGLAQARAVLAVPVDAAPASL